MHGIIRPLCTEKRALEATDPHSRGEHCTSKFMSNLLHYICYAIKKSDV